MVSCLYVFRKCSFQKSKSDFRTVRTGKCAGKWRGYDWGGGGAGCVCSPDPLRAHSALYCTDLKINELPSCQRRLTGPRGEQSWGSEARGTPKCGPLSPLQGVCSLIQANESSTVQSLIRPLELSRPLHVPQDAIT